MRRLFFNFWRGVAVGTVATLVIGSLELSPVPNAAAADSNTYRQLSLFGDVYERIRANFVESPDDKKLIKAAIDGMLSSLDPHSRYVDAEHFEDAERDITGEFDGIGIEVTMEEGMLKIVSALDETPAAAAGLQPNDIITVIDNQKVDGWSLAEAVDKMRGKIGTEITLGISRDGGEGDLTVRLVRANVKVQSVRTKVMGDDVGYIRISQFTQQTFPGLQRGLAKLNDGSNADNIKGIIIDLRNDPGGLLDQAIKVADSFLDHGEIVSTRGRSSYQSRAYFAEDGDLSGGKPIIVLVNGGSASASEIVAGALQDHKRATILGTRSFGKGTVQTILPIEGNGAIYLTTARYFTPSGRSIQALGITPDIVVAQEIPEELKGKDKVPGEKSLEGHLINPDAEPDDENIKGSSAYVPRDEQKDRQLLEALALVRGEATSEFFPPVSIPKLEAHAKTSD